MSGRSQTTDQRRRMEVKKYLLGKRLGAFLKLLVRPTVWTAFLRRECTFVLQDLEGRGSGTPNVRSVVVFTSSFSA
jgi:hypothetical protein